MLPTKQAGSSSQSQWRVLLPAAARVEALTVGTPRRGSL